jgi:hypothetical protein
MILFIAGSGTQAQRHSLLEFAKKMSPQQSDGLPYTTNLQVGGVYFITTNVDVADGLFNGSTGTLEKIEYYKNTLNEHGWILDIH